MKKIFAILGLAAISGGLVVGASVKNNKVNETKALNDEFAMTVKSVDGETINADGHLTIATLRDNENNIIGNQDSRNLTNKNGDGFVNWIAAQDATYWNEGVKFNALGSFYRGEIYEHWRGTVTSESWTQTTRYVLLQLGGRADLNVEFYNGETLLGSVNKGTTNGNPLVVTYFEIPVEKVSNETLAAGIQMNFKFTDSLTEGYGFLNIGYVKVNSSKKDISDAIWSQISSFGTAYKADFNEVHDRIREATNYYLNDSKYADVIGLSDNIPDAADEDFENNANFLNRWYRDSSYDEGFNDKAFGWDRIISHSDQHQHDRRPFNNDGGFFKGYLEPCVTNNVVDGSDTGFMNTDGSKYRFVSKPFILSGTGFVSIKMSGHPASVHVMRGNTELAFIDIKTNVRRGTMETDEEVDLPGNNIAWGYNANTMVRHVINLNVFKGQIIQLAIADVNCAGDYGAVNYDSLITKYTTNPAFKADTVTQYTNIHHMYYDHYVSRANTDIIYTVEATRNANTSDSSTVAEAYNYLTNTFYKKLRVKNSNAFADCANFSSSDLEAVVSGYSNLSAEAQAIVDASEDVTRDYSAQGENWYNKPFLAANYAGWVVKQIAAKNNIVINVKSSSNELQSQLVVSNNDTYVLALVIAVSSTLLLAMSFFLIKKKKHN